MSNPGPAITNSTHPQGLTSQQANRLLFVQKGLSVSAAGDTALPVTNSANYSVQQIVVANANVSGATVDVSGVNFGLYTQTSQKWYWYQNHRSIDKQHQPNCGERNYAYNHRAAILANSLCKYCGNSCCRSHR